LRSDRKDGSSIGDEPGDHLGRWKITSGDYEAAGFMRDNCVDLGRR
jgi:hypothetical protein